MQFVKTLLPLQENQEECFSPRFVGEGSGLAYHSIYGEEEDGPYQITHVQSGLSVGALVNTEKAAQRWIELLAPLFDWTQDQHTLSLTPDVAQKINDAYAQVLREREAAIQAFQSWLDPELSNAINRKIQTENWLTVSEVIEEAIYDALHKDEDIPFLGAVACELDKACEKHPPLNSLHEAYAVILEEMDELKAEVWKQEKARDYTAIRAELIQIAAMCARTEQDVL